MNPVDAAARRPDGKVLLADPASLPATIDSDQAHAFADAGIQALGADLTGDRWVAYGDLLAVLIDAARDDVVYDYARRWMDIRDRLAVPRPLPSSALQAALHPLLVKRDREYAALHRLTRTPTAAVTAAFATYLSARDAGTMNSLVRAVEHSADAPGATTVEVSVRVTNPTAAQRAIPLIHERIDNLTGLERRGSATMRGRLVEVTVGSAQPQEGVRFAVAAIIAAALSSSGNLVTGSWVRPLPGAATDQPLAQHGFTRASRYLDAAVAELQALRDQYHRSGLPDKVKQARVAAIDAKLAAVRDLHVNPHAHPWASDR